MQQDNTLSISELSMITDVSPSRFEYKLVLKIVKKEWNVLEICSKVYGQEIHKANE